jgi:hypothetical protein
MIWQLKNMPAVDQVIALLNRAGARWVSIKAAEGEGYYNQTGGNDKALLAFIDALVAAGIEVGGWGYVYPTRAGPQGGRASERIEKLGLAHWLIDAEREWKSGGLGKTAELYCSSLDVNKKFEVGLCSYRYPALHAPFPFGSFMHHEKVKLTAPQVYWALGHNPVEQLERCYAEYAALSDKPFIPIGATFGATFAASASRMGAIVNPTPSPDITIKAFERIQGKVMTLMSSTESAIYWEPTAADLEAFVAWCKAKKLAAYGFYSLDWIIQKNRIDWINAIAGGVVPPPPEPPPPPPVDVITPLWTGQVTGDLLNIRNQPNPAIVPATDIGDLIRGSKVAVVEERGEWARLSGWVKKSLLKKL